MNLSVRILKSEDLLLELNKYLSSFSLELLDIEVEVYQGNLDINLGLQEGADIDTIKENSKRFLTVVFGEEGCKASIDKQYDRLETISSLGFYNEDFKTLVGKIFNINVVNVLFHEEEDNFYIVFA